jgi:hypothetical protein
VRVRALASALELELELVVGFQPQLRGSESERHHLEQQLLLLLLLWGWDSTVCERYVRQRWRRKDWHPPIAGWLGSGDYRGCWHCPRIGRPIGRGS